MSGKGDTPRPTKLSHKEWAERWEKTFHVEQTSSVVNQSNNSSGMNNPK